MTREDYIIRAIAQFARALGRILATLSRLKSAGHVDEAVAAVRQEIERLMGFGPELIDTLSVHQTLTLLQPTIRAEPSRAGCFAVLLKERGDLLALQGNEPASVELSVKALALLLEVHAACGRFSLPQESAATEDLLRKVEAEDLPPHAREQLLTYLEETERYADAEDCLLAMLSDSENGRAALDLGLAFYRRLLERNDEELERGNLPRDEVERGLLELGALAGGCASDRL